ncbi:hypothetical protein CEXT_41031 [Caerostris extrusa]|uniref:Uncharacterized protein n=1 Tax=Caerostris extrusa TaxID=172846 RepID=A0AAV4QBX5_CAEEX|nr:hypothetical protein CEXT_41031 [Caerostris extrusa]
MNAAPLQPFLHRKNREFHAINRRNEAAQNSTQGSPVATNTEDIKLELQNFGFSVANAVQFKKWRIIAPFPIFLTELKRTNMMAYILQNKHITLFHHTSRILLQTKPYNTMF